MTSDWKKGLECVVGKAHLLVPVEFVSGVIELDMSPPPPLSRKWVGGLGFHEGRASLCVSLIPVEAKTASRRVKGIMLGIEGSEVNWILEVSTIGAFLNVQPIERKAPSHVPSWIGAVSDDKGQTFGFVDVLAMVKELAGTA